MIEQKRRTEIKKRVSEAQFGYGVMGNQEYFKDAGDLMKELEEAENRIEGYKQLVSKREMTIEGLNGQIRSLTGYTSSSFGHPEPQEQPPPPPSVTAGKTLDGGQSNAVDPFASSWQGQGVSKEPTEQEGYHHGDN